MAKKTKPKTSLRKSPKQRRSRELVDSVISAGTRILDSLGGDQFTTNKVAEIAGISIGSLYQYFPGKDAIFLKMIKDIMEKDAEKFRQIIRNHGSAEASVVLDEMISFLVELFSSKKVLLTNLFHQLPILGKTDDVLKKRNKTFEIFYEFLETRKSELKDPENIRENLYVIANSVIGVLQVSSLEGFSQHSPEVIKKRLKELVTGYLIK